MSKYYSFPYTIGFHDSDAAGVVFFANAVRMFHQACEAWMDDIGYSLGRLLKERPFGLPVVHVEADFSTLLYVGDNVEIRVRVAELGRTSYRTAYELIKDGRVAATAAIVQVCVDVKTYTAKELPGDFRKEIEQYL